MTEPKMTHSQALTESCIDEQNAQEYDQNADDHCDHDETVECGECGERTDEPHETTTCFICEDCFDENDYTLHDSFRDGGQTCHIWAKKGNDDDNDN